MPAGRSALAVDMAFLVGLMREEGALRADGERDLDRAADGQVRRMRLVPQAVDDQHLHARDQLPGPAPAPTAQSLR